MSLIELDTTVTFGNASTLNATIASPSVSSATAVGGVTPAIENIYGTLIFAPDRLAAVKAAIAANTAPVSTAYTALSNLAATWSGHPNELNSLASYYTANSLEGSLHLFACPGYYYDPTHSLQIQNFVSFDATASIATALYGYLSNQNAPTAQNIVRAWSTTITSIDQLPNPPGDNGNDAPLIAGTLMNGFLIAACILDEGLNGNWSASSGWTTTDRTNMEQWIINVYYPALQVIINPFVSGAPASGMLNNWRSWAIYGSALSAFYLQSSTNSTTAATGQSYMTATIAALNNAISGVVSEAGTLTSPPTTPATNAIVTSAFTYTGVTPNVAMNVGDLFLENLRGADQVHYNYFSLLPLCSACQVINAALASNVFAGQFTLLSSALTEELSRLSPLQAGQNSDVPFTYELYEAMGALFGNASYTAYASPNRPVMPGGTGSSTNFQHISVFFAPTLTTLLNPVVATSGPGPNQPAGMTTVINTGPLTATPNYTQGGTWTTAFAGTTITWTMNSPSTVTANGEVSSNVTVVPGGSGYRIAFPTNVTPGGTPVQFFPNGFSTIGTGYYYMKWLVRVSSNYSSGPSNGGNPGIKIAEPRTNVQGPSSTQVNDYFGLSTEVAGDDNAWVTFGLQGVSTYLIPRTDIQPGEDYGVQGPFNVYQGLPANGSGGNTTLGNIGGPNAGNWYEVEYLFTPESVIGAGDGTYKMWINGQAAMGYSGIQWRPTGVGAEAGWLSFYVGPTYGGGHSSPPYSGIYWDFDQLYISVK